MSGSRFYRFAIVRFHRNTEPVAVLKVHPEILWVELRNRTSSAESREAPKAGVSILGRGRNDG